MQQLGASTITVDGVTVFSDHADPNQFWYLPAPVALAKRASDGRPAFTLIKWRPAAVEAGAKGGGFLMLEANLKLPEATERAIRSQLRRSGAREDIRLSAVPFDGGTVKCIALDLEGPGGTARPDTAPPGTFVAVEAISGAAVPSLSGDNVAAFSLTLSQEGAIILEQAFTQGTTPVGVIYDLTYTILRPALQVVITANYEDVYTHFSAGLEAQVYWVKAGIDAGFEKLVADGAIKIEVIEFSSPEDRADKAQWALDFFKDNLLSKWFEPSITPADVESRIAKPEGLDAVMTRARAMANPTPSISPTPTETEGSGRSGGNTSGGNTSGGNTSGGNTSGGNTSGGNTSGGGSTNRPQPSRAPATLTVAPQPPPAGHNLRLEPGSTTDQERIAVDGPAGWSATVGSAPAVVQDGRIVLNVPGGAPAQTTIVVTWPAAAPSGGTTTTPPTVTSFNLYFTKAKPDELPGYGSTHANARDYSATGAGDTRFLDASGPAGQPPSSAAPRGGDRFRAWLDALPSPRLIALDGHASFEIVNPDPLASRPGGRDDYDFKLSQRRIDVARACIQGRATVTSATWHGHSRARDASPQRLDNPDDRVVEVRWVGGSPTPTPTPTPQATVLTGTIIRSSPTPTPTPTPTPGPTPSPTPPVPSSMPALVSFKLKFIRKEERKTLTLRYNRTEAVTRTYAPQGFIGLMLEDIDDMSKHFVEVDLDDPFFRTFEVTVDAPVDYARVGLNSINVAIDYGDPNNPVSMKHEDLIFDAASPTRATFATFVSPDLESAYSVSRQFHFDAVQGSGWRGERLSYELPAVDTVDRTLVVTPHEHLGFLEVQVIANRIDDEMVDRIEVALAFDDPSGWQARDTFIVRPGDEQKSWKIRTSSPDTREYSYTLTHHLKDGSQPIVDEPVFTSANAVSVDDPFPNALEIDLVPAWDPALIRQVFVDINYSDPNNDIDRSERIQFTGDDLVTRRVRLALRDRTQRSFTWKALFLGTDNSSRQIAPETTTETLILLTP